MVPSGKVDVSVDGRVPRVAVPAEYLGAAVLPAGGFYDLWLAGDPDTAEAAAEELNQALARKLDRKPQIPATRDLAAAEGPAVNAVGGNVQVSLT